MYAIIVNGGKQYKVSEGLTLTIDKVPASAGETLTFETVLLVNEADNVTVGKPYTGHVVTAEVVEHGRAKKIEIIKFKRRKHHLKRQGHRQDFTKIKIVAIAAA